MENNNNNNNKKEKFKSVGLLSTKNTLDLIHQIDIIDQIDMIDYIAASYPYIIFLAANIIYIHISYLTITTTKVSLCVLLFLTLVGPNAKA